MSVGTTGQREIIWSHVSDGGEHAWRLLGQRSIVWSLTLLRRQVAFLPQLLSYSFGGEPDAAERLDVKGSAGVWVFLLPAVAVPLGLHLSGTFMRKR